MKSRNSVKMIAAMLCTVLVLTVLTSCGNAQSATPTPAPAEQTAVDQASMPIVTEPITLTCFMGKSAPNTTESNAELLSYIEMEKRSGIKIDFRTPASGTETEQYNLMMASGDLTDMIWGRFPNADKLIADGMIVDLTGYTEYFPNLMKVYEDSPETKRQATLDDGTHYMFGDLRVPDSVKAGGPIVRKDWLDKLSLSPPANADEWYDMLTAFKVNDMSGTGNTLPLIAQNVNWGTNESLQAFSGLFDFVMSFCKDVSGKVVFGPYTDNYRDFVTTMNKWYTEGLIDPEFAATDGALFRAKATGNLAGAWMGRINGSLGNYLNAMKDSGTDFDLIGIEWPKGPAGKQFGTLSVMATISDGLGMVISTSNKYLIETIRWLDYCYSYEGYMLFGMGIEGQSYDYIDGKPYYNESILNNPDGLSAIEAKGLYVGTSMMHAVTHEDSFAQVLVFQQQRDTINVWSNNLDTSLLLPPLRFSSADNTTVEAIMADARTYVDEMFVKFVMGTEPLSGLDNYFATLKKMNIEKATELYANAYSKYLSK